MTTTPKPAWVKRIHASAHMGRPIDGCTLCDLVMSEYPAGPAGCRETDACMCDACMSRKYDIPDVGHTMRASRERIRSNYYGGAR